MLGFASTVAGCLTRETGNRIRVESISASKVCDYTVMLLTSFSLSALSSFRAKISSSSRLISACSSANSSTGSENTCLLPFSWPVRACSWTGCTVAKHIQPKVFIDTGQEAIPFVRFLEGLRLHLQDLHTGSKEVRHAPSLAASGCPNIISLEIRIKTHGHQTY